MEEATVDENESKRETPRREGTTKRKVGQKKKRTNGGEKRKTNKKKREEEEVDDDDGTRSAGMRSAHEKGNAEHRRRKTKVATQTNLMNPTTTTTTSATTSKQYRNATLWQRRNRTDSRPKKKHSKMASIGRRCLTKFDVVLFILGTISEDRVPVIVFALMATLTWNKIRRKTWKPSVTVRLRQFHSVVIKSSFF